MKSKLNSAINEEALPDIIKKKLESYKVEGRLENKKDLKFDNYLSIKSNEKKGNKKFRVTLEILNYSNLEIKPVIPLYGKLITEVFRIRVTDVKGIDIKKESNISYSIKASDINQYCYPLVSNNNIWKIAERFSVESDGIRILDLEWDIVLLIREPSYEIISISPNGGIINSELDKVMNLRIPKGIFKETTKCKLQFVKMSEEMLVDFRLVYEELLSPFVKISSIFVVQPIDENRDLVYDEQTFRRPITVKIPLPDWVISCLKENNFDTKKTIKNQMKEKLGFYFLEKVSETWKFFENHLNFTQNSLGFDTKHFGKFIFLTCRENREIRLCQQMNIVEDLQICEQGVILTFLYIKNQKWYLWIEAVPINRISSVRETLQSNGLLFVEQFYEYSVKEENSNGRRLSRKFSKIDVLQRKTIELYENIQFELTIKGDIEKYEQKVYKESNRTTFEETNNEKKTLKKDIDSVNFDQIGRRKSVIVDPNVVIEDIVNPDLSYHSLAVNSNAVIVEIKPIERSLKEWTNIILNKLNKKSLYESNDHIQREVINIPVNGIVQTDIDLNLLKPNMDHPFQSSQLSKEEKNFNFQCEVILKVLNPLTELIIVPPQKFEFIIPIETMKDYFNVLTKEETDELELERIRLQNEEVIIENVEEKRIKVKESDPNKVRSVNYTRINLLSNPRIKNKAIIKDSKVISTKSLLALSSVIRQGLTLAVYLYLPENVIAGIGFDSLSQISMNGINNTTYKVLVTWKKSIHLNKISEEIYINQLMDALKMLGYENISSLIFDHWKNNTEISVDDYQRRLLKGNDY